MKILCKYFILVVFSLVLNSCYNYNNDSNMKKIIRYALLKNAYYKNCLNYNEDTPLNTFTAICYKQNEKDGLERTLYAVKIPAYNHALLIVENKNKLFFDGCGDNDELDINQRCEYKKIKLNKIYINKELFLKECYISKGFLNMLNKYLYNQLKDADKKTNNTFYIGPFSQKQDGDFYVYWENKRHIYLIKNPYSFLNDEFIRMNESEIFHVYLDWIQTDADAELINKLRASTQKIIFVKS